MSKKIHKWAKVLVLCLVLLAVVACSREPLNASSSGFVDQYILLNLSRFIIWLSNLFNGNYGMGIILFTLIIRVLLIPVNNMQMKSQRQMQEIKPELEAIQAKYPNKDRQSRELMQEEQAQLMEERGFNQFAGCLPLLIQLPVMMALYQTILRTEELRQGHFLWMNLGQPDPYFILPILASLLVFYNTYLMSKANPVSNAASKSMMYTMPLMILLISIGLPSAISLYFVVSNGFSVLQTLIFNNPYKIIAEREAEAAAEKEHQRELKRQLRRKTGKRK
ncbi:YidC/Oxa1 family membrane protein insertase [Hutsoniella sourekii]|uniref:YidC/Oxa1 family membrane protein insertase n=1 Tax=Hutsoniella sourekii TaxID=87650 RepID=UPI00048582AC|nr:YidC/Oxa1 family membrane protein insertase [Hutsoniella sourekii]